MSRISPAHPDALGPEERALYEDLGGGAMGAALVQAPTFARGYLALDRALVHGAFRPRVQEQLSLTVSEANACVYCLSSHVETAASLRISPEEIERNRAARADDPKVEAALQFARAVVDSRGGISDDELAAIRAAGYGEPEILELVGHVALNTLTNYINKLIDATPDSPTVQPHSHLTATGAAPRPADGRR